MKVTCKYFKLFFIVLTYLFLFNPVLGAQPISLDMQNINLPDAIHFMAKFLDLNVVVSPAIRGTVSLRLHDAKPSDAFELLLTSQGLAKWPMGNIWFVAPRLEWIKHKQDELRLQEVMEETTPLVTQSFQIHYAKADDIAHLLQDSNASLLSKRGHVRVDVRTNMICVQDLPKQIQDVRVLIKKMDIPVQQVLIEARLASVDSDFERELGVNFAVQAPRINREEGLVPSVSDPISRNTHFSLAVAKLADGSLLDVALSALENEGRGELISSPSLFTANQQTALIESGEEIPYQEVSASGATSVSFKKAVLSLKVTPQVLPGNKVLLQLQVNQDKPSNRIVLGVPAISTRQIATSILINNGQTLVLGGIYESNKEHEEQRIPFLGKIPLVGVLFRQQNAREGKRELLIFVTPKIISEKLMIYDQGKKQ